jgi:hypothetical protein
MTAPGFRRGRDQHGSVMTLALGFLVVLLVVAAGVHGLVLNQLRESGQLRQRRAAEELADGGIARAIAWFKSAKYQPPAAKLLKATVPVELASNAAPLVLPDNHPDQYTDALGQARSGVVTDYRGALDEQRNAVGVYRVVATLMSTTPETWELVATATVGGVQRQAGGLLVREATGFAYGLFGDSGVQLSGAASTDSYDSTLGPYGGANRSDGGNVGSNGDITLQGSARINGDATAGPEGQVIAKGNPTVTGESSNASSAQSLDPVTIPAGAVSIGNLKVANNDRRTVYAGTYVINDFTVEGGGVLTIDTSGGPVVFYVTGSTSIGGNGQVVVTNNGARAFSVFQTSDAAVQIEGSGGITASIYAPRATLKLSGAGALFGAFVGGAATLAGSAALHFDQSLRTAGGSGALHLMARWTAPAPPAPAKN